MTAYYNENNTFCAAWLRELIKLKVIADGIVDERSIVDVRPNEIAGFTQCHFFAGIGVWSAALRAAGWPDDRPVWTGSEPCQPFSDAGKGLGFADERYLRPFWQHLIAQCRPPVIFGEQVASKDGLAWLDVIQADLEGETYAFGAVDTCAAGFGAPHIRQRLYWVADATGSGRQQQQIQPGDDFSAFGRTIGSTERLQQPSPNGSSFYDRLGHTSSTGREGESDGGSYVYGQSGSSFERTSRQPSRRLATCKFSGMADSESRGRGERGNAAFPRCGGYLDSGGDTFSRVDISPSGGFKRFGDQPEHGESLSTDSPCVSRPGPVNGLWSPADWLLCRDDKWRAVRPGTFPLANAGAYRNRVGLLRGAGNAINLAQAQGFIEAYLGV